jgi:multisubunit Na+/H+ antiporter MnhB subunit
MKRILVIPAAFLFVLVLIPALVDLAPSVLDLRPLVAANLASSGVAHPVTAVLLNYRAYDTLLEIGVLLLALVAILAVRGSVPGTASTPATSPDPLLPMLGRIAAPVMVVVAVYLLWAGTSRPGGAFQAGAVLAASAVLLHLTGLRPGWQQPGADLRWGLAGGFLLFLGVGAILLLVEGDLLRYPPDHAGVLILLIESGLTLSLGLILAGLFLFLSHDKGGEQ